ncbi:tRNA pseudouridine(55) synthase TruB [Novosphingobium sp. 9U]|uniref:tRNA pseudouridine(55) synthase TruB n=1 Tax=Novosphingobium sp. 9U TaxID=2653158 RepID=UPI0012F314A5|nr:tRNA pseudouridine(55) synthase TruB [Novosphingobium sp. 9U]VWX46809.1 tRNA pseudouridine synthase B [Novosphingobium sp. 9U]
MLSGWIILDKPVGLGSTQAVAAVKRNLREAGFGKSVKVGHGGTLDPLASGVLPVALGEATKVTGRMLDANKAYEFTVRFGEETDTLDLEGAVIATSDVRPSMAEIEAVLPRFTGPIAQVPPAYSALKVDGERAYDLARAGQAVELASRDVTIYSLQILSHRERGTARAASGGEGVSPADLVSCRAPSGSPDGLPLPPTGEELSDITLLAIVSKGTYIRSLARDIAQALGTCGTVTMLRRTKAGPFDLSHAISLDKLNEIGKGAPLEHVTLPLEAGLDDIPAIDLDPEQARAVRQGRVLTGLPLEDGLHLARLRMIPVALLELSGGDARVSRGFNLPDVAE